MIAFLRFFVPLLILQTIAYAVAVINARWRRARRLETEWEAQNRPGELDDFIDQGLDAFEKTLRYKLLLAIYIVPWVALVFIVQWANG